MPVRHVVVWRLKPEAEGRSRAQNAAFMREALLSCAMIVPGIQRFEVGVAGEGTDSNADIALDSTFADWQALEAYQSHPAHAALAPLFKPLREDRSCVDWEVPA